MRLAALAAVASLALSFGSTAFGAEMKPFSQAAFKAAQAAGGPIIVDVYAPWCPVCAAQEPVLHQLEADPAYQNVTLLRVDFDRMKTVLRDLNVAQQSTILGFHGSHEIGRLAGSTGKPAIEGLFTAAVKG